MKQFPIFMALMVLSLWSFAQSAKDEAVATVGTHKITVEEFNRRYSEAKEKAINVPSKAEFLEALIRQEVGLQEANKRGVEKNPKVADMLKQALYAGFLELELGQKIQTTPVTEKEMQEYYKKNPEIRVSYILTELKGGATKEQRAEAKGRAEKIYEEVKASKRPFEELVKLYSDDSLTKSTGGDAGWQSRATLIPAYYEAILPMKIGDIKGVLETPYGFHIVKVTGLRAYENADRRTIRKAVFDLKRVQTFNEFFEKLKKGYSIKTNSKLIE